MAIKGCQIETNFGHVLKNVANSGLVLCVCAWFWARKCNQIRPQLCNLFWQWERPHMPEIFDFSGQNFLEDSSFSFLLLSFFFILSFSSFLLPPSPSSLLNPALFLLPPSFFLVPPFFFLSFVFFFYFGHSNVMLWYCLLCWRSWPKSASKSETEKRHACETISEPKYSPVLCVTVDLLIFLNLKRDQNRPRYRTLQSEACKTNDDVQNEFAFEILNNVSQSSSNFGSKLFVVFLALQSKPFQKSIVTVIATVAIKPSATSTSHRIHFTSQLRFYISPWILKFYVEKNYHCLISHKNMSTKQKMIRRRPFKPTRNHFQTLQATRRHWKLLETCTSLKNLLRTFMK